MFKNILALLILLIGFGARSQSIKGKIVDFESKKPISNAQIVLVDFQTEAQCDTNGNFTIQGNYSSKTKVFVSAIGYQSLLKTFDLSNQMLIYLKPMHFDLDEVTVKASRSELKRKSVNYVELKSIKELNEIPQVSLGQMLEKIPGVYNLSTGPGISKPVIRGLSGARVITLLNGVRVAGQRWGGDHGIGITALGIGTVEVLKGPASLLYGADALGGVLYLSNESYGNQGTHQIQAKTMFESTSMGTVNSLLYNGSMKNIKLIVGGRYVSHADYRLPNKMYVKNSRFQDRSAKLALGWHKGKWVGNLRYDYSSSMLGVTGHTHETNPVPEDFMATQQKRKKTLPVQYLTNHIASLENKFILQNHTVQILTSFTSNRLIEYDEKVTIPAMLIDLLTVPYKVNVESRLKNHIKLSYGLQGRYLIQKNGSQAEERMSPNAHQLDNGLYFITAWEKNKWVLQGGARIDMRNLTSEKDFKFINSFSNTYMGYNFSVGANYSPSKQHIFRLNVSTGFRTPQLTELLSNGEHHGSFRYLKGNELLTTEKAAQIDFSYEYLGEHISLVFNPYINGIQDYIFLQPEDSIIEELQLFTYQQSKPYVLQTGADVGVHWHPHFAHILHIESSFSYLAMFSSNTNVFSLIPQPRWSNSISIRFGMKTKFKVDNVTLKHSYYLPQHTVSQFEKASVDFSVVNVGAQFSLDGKIPLKLQIGCRNLFKESYINHLSRLKSLELANPGRSFYINLVINLNFNSYEKSKK